MAKNTVHMLGPKGPAGVLGRGWNTIPLCSSDPSRSYFWDARYDGCKSALYRWCKRCMKVRRAGKVDRG